MSRAAWAVRRRLRSMQAAGMYVTSASRCAARLARLTGCAVSEAAKFFGVNPGGAWNAWERLYPGLPPPVRKYRGVRVCAACGEPGHVAVLGKCSPSSIALRLVAGGATVSEAADRLGLTTAAVYAADSHRRRAS